MGKAKRLKEQKKQERTKLNVTARIPQRKQSKFSPKSGDRRA